MKTIPTFADKLQIFTLSIDLLKKAKSLRNSIDTNPIQIDLLIDFNKTLEYLMTSFQDQNNFDDLMNLMNGFMKIKQSIKHNSYIDIMSNTTDFLILINAISYFKLENN